MKNYQKHTLTASTKIAKRTTLIAGTLGDVPGAVNLLFSPNKTKVGHENFTVFQVKSPLGYDISCSNFGGRGFVFCYKSAIHKEAQMF